jgi:leucine dehydrogenase
MTPDMMELIRKWDGTGVVVRYDRPTGTWIFVAIHEAILGPTTGGCRIRQYPTPADALEDAMRLAEGMTYKWASIGFPFGGGKSVLAISRPVEGEERVGLFKRFGHLLASLQGAYSTGQDMGTTTADMGVIAGACDYVMGAPKDGGQLTDPGPFTALGVFEGMKTALRHATGSDDLVGRRVLVQGVGDVGGPLARLVADAGATVLVSDLDDARVRGMAQELGGEVVYGNAIFGTECDVFAPCAVGAVLNEQTIPQLRCAVVAGSANNQLAEPGDAERLHARGILYAPDYVINAGGAMAFGLLHQGVHEDEALAERVRSLGTVLDEIFREAREQGTTPVRGAASRVERLLAQARAQKGMGPEFER